jgi:DNA modification methylase
VLPPYYEQGGIAIYHGDCRDVLPTLPTASVDLLIADPPYGVHWSSGRGRMGGIFGDDGEMDVIACLRLACRVLKLKRHLYVFGPFDLSQVTIGATTELIWDKVQFGSGDLSLPWGPAHERIAFGVLATVPADKGTGEMAARLRRSSVLRVRKQNNGLGALKHPTEKPVLLARHLIEASSVFDDTVLDPYRADGRAT